MALVRLLVVDDFRLWRDCIKEHLEGHADLYVAGFASDGLEALQKVEELQPDLVILDISLPELSGIEAARRIRKSSPNCKILFLTGHAYPEMVRGALEAGGCAYVHKEDALTELLAGLEAALAGRQYLSSSVNGSPRSDLPRRSKTWSADHSGYAPRQKRLAS
jgi:two-component system response regulator NreC